MFEYYDDTVIERHHFRNALVGVKVQLKHLRLAIREVAKTWPGLPVILVGMLPRRVWQVSGPPGWGPSGETPEEAARFIRNDCGAMETDAYLTDEEREYYLNAPRFTPEELRRLWYPGARIERDGWSIRCNLVRRFDWGLYEWDGY